MVQRAHDLCSEGISIMMEPEAGVTWLTLRAAVGAQHCLFASRLGHPSLS